jgi:beta-glucosidase
LGEAGGAALAHVLAGQVNPSGKLPITIPQHEGQLPLSYWHEPTGRGNDYVNGTGEPLYPFGHGLSYTQFEYRDLKIEQTSLGSNDTLNLSFTIQNTGAYPGAEALQFYIKPIYCSETLPVQYLIRTEKTRLKNGETQLYLHYKIPVAALGIPTGPISTALPTQFYLQIGASSKDIRLQSPVITLSE